MELEQQTVQKRALGLILHMKGAAESHMARMNTKGAMSLRVQSQWPAARQESFSWQKAEVALQEGGR